MVAKHFIVAPTGQDRTPLVDPIWCHNHEQWECPYIANVSVEAQKEGLPIVCCHDAVDVCADHK